MASTVLLLAAGQEDAVATAHRVGMVAAVVVAAAATAAAAAAAAAMACWDQPTRVVEVEEVVQDERLVGEHRRPLLVAPVAPGVGTASAEPLAESVVRVLSP